mmetsp:Transcript_50278/g.114111  ORF Transcript_50278/g.114111 Transcript_50278/m.114111 type:complete len:241 (+) Transcript_50278:237-959(+)
MGGRTSSPVGGCDMLPLHFLIGSRVPGQRCSSRLRPWGNLLHIWRHSSVRLARHRKRRREARQDPESGLRLCPLRRPSVNRPALGLRQVERVGGPHAPVGRQVPPVGYRPTLAAAHALAPARSDHRGRILLPLRGPVHPFHGPHAGPDGHGEPGVGRYSCVGGCLRGPDFVSAVAGRHWPVRAPGQRGLGMGSAEMGACFGRLLSGRGCPCTSLEPAARRLGASLRDFLVDLEASRAVHR